LMVFRHRVWAAS